MNPSNKNRITETFIAVLALALSGFGVYLFDKIWGDEIHWEAIRKFNIGKYLEKPIPLILVISFLALWRLLDFLGKKLIPERTIYTRKQRKLRKYNSFIDGTNNIKYRWNVYFDSSGNPFIANLEAFCNKHNGAPIRFINKICPHVNCQNNTYPINFSLVQNNIESDLIDKWDKMR